MSWKVPDFNQNANGERIADVDMDFGSTSYINETKRQEPELVWFKVGVRRELTQRNVYAETVRLLFYVFLLIAQWSFC